MKLRIAILLLVCSLGASLAFAAGHPSWWMPLAALAGWYAADAASGIIHMYMDYRPCRPGVGLDRLFFYEGSRESPDYLALRDRTLAQLGPFERLVFDFKNHHPRPDALGRRSIMAQIGTTIRYAALPVALLLNLLCLVPGLPGWVALGGVTFLIGGTFAQYFHGTLHRADNPWPVRLLRRVRLLMRPEDHHRHHRTLTCDFSTNTGWSNPAVNLLFRTMKTRGYLREDGLEPG